MWVGQQRLQSPWFPLALFKRDPALMIDIAQYFSAFEHFFGFRGFEIFSAFELFSGRASGVALRDRDPSRGPSRPDPVKRLAYLPMRPKSPL